MTMKAHIYYIIFGRPPIGGSFPLPPGGATGSGTHARRWFMPRDYRVYNSLNGDDDSARDNNSVAHDNASRSVKI